jgi:ketosteroid isomerase-like protein
MIGLALAAAACGGGGGGGDDDAKDAANEYFEAIASGNAGGVCDHLTRDAQQAFARQVRGKDCQDAARKILEGPQGSVSKGIAREAKVNEVKVDGDNATAQVATGNDIKVSLQLRKEDGDWKISQLPGT